MTPAPPRGYVETINCAKVYFEVHGTGQPLVLLHGFSGSGENWTATISDWRNRFQLIVPDLPGHGKSGILTRPFRHRDAATDLLALLDHLGIHACKGLGISCGDVDRCFKIGDQISDAEFGALRLFALLPPFRVGWEYDAGTKSVAGGGRLGRPQPPQRSPML
jgi:hypothetical protein